jgi:DNA-binding transcriptional ArsR family regulator
MSSRRSTATADYSDQAFDLMAEWFRVLSEPSRLRIVHALQRGERNISELAQATGLSQPNVTRHIQALVACGIVGRRKVGVSQVCSIADPAVLELCRRVCRELQRRLKANAGVLR